MNARETQQRLISLGYSLPKYGADGDFGQESLDAVNSALDELSALRGGSKPVSSSSSSLLKKEWLQKVSMSRIIAHWSAGAHKASALDKEHYHFIIEGDGTVVKGDHDISDNVNTSDDDYAAHTLYCNTGSIGVSLACMAGATESPFNSGAYPMTQKQWDVAMEVIAELAAFYGIAVTNKTILSHAEVQPNLGIKQKSKWDISRLSFNPSTVGAKACGDKMRSEVSSLMKSGKFSK